MNFKKLISELKRRNVFKVATAYAIAGWLIIQICTSTFPYLHLPDWLITAVIVFVLIGFPISVIVAWAFEVTPEGVKRTDEVPVEKSATKKSGRKLNVVLGVLLVFTVGIIFYQQFFKTQPVVSGAVSKGKTVADSAPAKSIAVLPFENLSTDSANAYFADGMQDLILTKLADIGDLKVISRTSTERYKSHPGDLKTIASQLGVSNILEGSVQKSGNQVLINVQLIDAQNDNHIWANSYTRTLNNVFGVEGEVAEKVADVLKTKLDPTEQVRLSAVPTHNPDAYDAYLKGLSFESNTSGFGFISLRDAAAAYQKAVKLDPDYALAWAHLSTIYSGIYFQEYDPTQERLAAAKEALDKALRLAPDGIETQIALGDYYYHGLRHYEKAIKAYRKVLQMVPNNTYALNSIGFVERRQGHWQAAINYMEHSLILDPRNVSTITNLAISYFALLRFDKAVELLKSALEVNPTDPVVITSLASVYQSEGELEKSAAILDSVKINPVNWIDFSSYVRQDLLTRHYTNAIRLLKKTLTQKQKLSGNAQGTYYNLLGYLNQLDGHNDAAHNAYKMAIKALQYVPESPQVLGMRANAQAGLGEKASAIASAQRAVRLLPTSIDEYNGPFTEYWLAIIQASLGEKKQAITILKQLLAMPAGFNVKTLMTPALLRIDPRYDPLRKDPAFQALLKKYPWKQG